MSESAESPAAPSTRERKVLVLGKRLPPEDLFVIAGPCVLESAAMAFEVAAALKEITSRLGIRLIFKASYRKDNRSDVRSFTGLGDREGLRILRRIHEELDLPILTDVHGLEEIAPASEVASCLQIPAFLSRQTRLLQEAAKASRCVNVKKGQFLAPDDMGRVTEKLRAAVPSVEIWLTERGTTFGYHNLVVDMRGIASMRALGAAVVFDVTHSLQHPGSGGDRRFALPLARAALGAGADGLFFETHPDPPRALSDSTTQLPLRGIGAFLEEMVEWKHLQARSLARTDPVGEDGGEGEGL
jgi:2-dehydro-3-deoxyphosphooctonate aldolase (KDO 8-P synthase)